MKEAKIFFGGTFDPIHYGHIKSALAVVEKTQLKPIIFLPNYLPPHRNNPKASPKQRLEMIKLAILEIAEDIFRVDDRELKVIDFSWTIKTFLNLRIEYGKNCSIILILGQDSLSTLHTWYSGFDLLFFCHLFICIRPGIRKDDIYKKYENHRIKNRITQDLNLILQNPSGFIYFVETPEIYISSKNIRKNYKNGNTCKGMLPISVQNYIYKEKLYLF